VAIPLVDFNNQFGIPISQRDENDSERNKHQRQQRSMARQIHDVDVDIRANEMRNLMSTPRGLINENRTGPSQKHLILGYGRKWKYLFLNMNNMALQITPGDGHSNFPHRTGGIRGGRAHGPVYVLSPE
jgi:hypothetical protein